MQHARYELHMQPSTQRSRLARALRRFVRERRGNVLVEFALVTPILAVLTCAIIDFSLVLFTINNLTNAVRQGARRAVLTGTPVAAVIRTEVCNALTIRPATGTCDSYVQMLDSSYTSGRVRVRIVNYPYTPMTPIAPLFGMSTILLSREAAFRSEVAPF
jgi:Flp pilus assembly protein TadG